MHDPRVSFVIATHNRRDVLLQTLAHVMACGLPAAEFEVLVVDNASTDATAEAVRRLFPSVQCLRQCSNRGPCAKNIAIQAAQGEFVIFLDDDSFPQPRSVSRMMEHFRLDPLLGAAVFTITLPNGSRECSAYPDVCIGCGTGFRRKALLQVGGLPQDFFMAAEEYDLSLRLLDAGWHIRTFSNLHVTHLKTPVSRFTCRITRLDARNNVLLAMRYFPEPWRMAYVQSWLARYRLMALANQSRMPFWLGALEGIARGIAAEHRPINLTAFEQFAKIHATRRRLHEISRRANLKRVLFVDLGKNYLAYSIAAQNCGVEVVAIADQRLGGRGFCFGPTPILTDQQAMRLDFDTAIISNLSPVHACARLAQWRKLQSRPVLALFGGRLWDVGHFPPGAARNVLFAGGEDVRMRGLWSPLKIRDLAFS